MVNLKFKKDGTDIWANYTAQNVGKQVAMVLKCRVLTAPTVQSAIPGGETRITGQFTQAEAQQLARDIAGG